MRLIKKYILIKMIVLPLFLSSQAFAGVNNICMMAKMNLVEGGHKYSATYDRMRNILAKNNISFIKLNSYQTSNLFSIGDDLELSGDSVKTTSIYIEPKAAAKNNGGDFYLFGKLQGLISHTECGLDEEYVNGHAWAADYSQFRVRKYPSGVRVHTTLNKAGSMVARGYRPTVSQYSSGYADETIIVRLQDFRGNSTAYREFMELFAIIENSFVSM